MTEDNSVLKRTGFYESFDGTKIYYEVRGEGRPIVLCYGIACLINHWIHQLRYFSGNYQTIVFDYRGHHQTAAPEDSKNLSLEATCKDLQGLLDHLGIERASFWGHSYGVQVLLRFYDLFPEKVDDLVFINGFAKNPLKGMFGIDTIEPVFKFFKESHKMMPATFSSLWKTAVTNPLAIPISSLLGGFNMNLTNLKDIEVYARAVGAMDLNLFLELFDEMLNYDGSEVLDRIKVPTLIISGTKDGVTPRDHQEQMHRRIHGSQFVEVPYGSHCTQLDLPEYVNLRIEKFLNEIGYTPRAGDPPKAARKRPWHS